jgi:spore maturation protein B
MDLFRDLLSSSGIVMLTLVIVGFPLYGLWKRVPVYESFVAGAKEGFTTSITIVPYLVAILFAFAMFRASGALDAITGLVGPLAKAIGVPPEILPMAITRPLSGSGSLGILAETKATYGVGSEITAICATIFASSETTFYVIAVYFGAVGIRRTRHAVATGLIADVAGVFLAVIFVKLLMR